MIARWESRSGKWWVELHRSDAGCYSYTANDSGGTLGNNLTNEVAIDAIEQRIANGYFQPDNLKSPMKRVV